MARLLQGGQTIGRSSRPHRAAVPDSAIEAARMTQAVLIYNPVAGRKKRQRPHQIQAAKDELTRSGIAATIVATTCSGDGSRLAREAIQAGAELIVVCGGDGTINDVAGGMVNSPVPLAVLPGGTANVLARELGLPLDIAAAARMISGSVPRRIALGRAGDHHFLMMAGVGFDAQVIHGVNSRVKKSFGMAAYIIEALRQLMFEPLTPFIVTSGTRRHQVTFACISRCRYYGPLLMIPEADLFSDDFYVYCFHSQSRLRYLLYAVAVLAGQPGLLYDFSRFPARRIYCEPVRSNRRDVYIQVDGELSGHLPCSIEIVPDALTLMVPAEALTGSQRPVRVAVPLANALIGGEESACPESPSATSGPNISSYR